MSSTLKRVLDENSDGDVIPKIDRPKLQRVETTILQSCSPSVRPEDHTIHNISTASTSSYRNCSQLLLEVRGAKFEVMLEERGVT
jgi:hypothetical protein